MGKRDEASAVVDALDTGTSSRERLLQIGWLLLNQGRGERALAVAEGVLAGADFPAAHLLRGGALAALGRTDEAAVELGAIPPEEPEFIAAQLRLSRALSEAGRGREAIELLAGALSRTQPRPQSDALATQLAELIERGGDRQRARRVLDDALKLHPTSDALCYALGGLLDRGGEGDKALEVVGAILERSPDNAEAHNFIGWNLTERNLRLKEALRHLERAHALRPTSGEIADSLGWLYFKLDRAEEATRLLEVAARLLPEAPEVLGHLGEAYLKRDDRPRALAAFRQALAHSPEPRVRQALEQKLLFLEEGRVGAR